MYDNVLITGNDVEVVHSTSNFLILLGMLPCFGALVVPRYGQIGLILVGAAALICPPCPNMWEGIAYLLLLLMLSFGSDFFFARRGAWEPAWKDAVAGGFLGLAAGVILVCMNPILFPLVGPACFIGALVPELKTARKQNAQEPAVSYYAAGACVRLVLGFLMAGVTLLTLFPPNRW